MIIHKPKITKEKDEICVSAEIELDNPIPGIPNKLWYRFPKDQEKFVSDRADGFTAALLQFAMYINEDIEVKGTLSPKLKRGLEEYQSIFNVWFPKLFKKIKIKCKNLKKQISKRKKRVTCSFSGGIDSFYKIFSSLNELDPDYKVSHTLFIHGFDIDLKKQKNYDIAIQTYEGLMKKLNLKLLKAKTNLRQFEVYITGNDFGHLSFATFISSVALILNISRHYIPSSYNYPYLDPDGSHPMSDHLLSTESVEIIHCNADVKRIEKIEFISQFPETYSCLRVCGFYSVGLKNCCRCEKCLRTMTSLALFGKLHKYKTFPLKLTHKSIRQSLMNYHNYHFGEELLACAVSLGRKDIVFDVKYAIIRSKIKNKVQPMIDKIWKLSAKLKKRSKIYRNFVKLIK